MTKDHFKEPLPPGVKNLDNYEIDFPEHNLEDYVCYSNKGAKQPTSNSKDAHYIWITNSNYKANKKQGNSPKLSFSFIV